MNYSYHFEKIPGFILRIMQAFPVTLEIMLISLAISIAIGAVMAKGSLGGNNVLKALSNGYIAFMRGIPTLVLIFLLYLGMPQVMLHFGVNMSKWNKLIFIIASISLSTSANMAEMMRASYLAVNKGQIEAAYSVGMKPFTAFRRIVFPQAFGIAIPTLGNNIVMLFKETSLAFSIGIIDVFSKARVISGASYGTYQLELYIAAGIIYWVFCVLIEQLTRVVELFYTKGRKKATS